MEKFKKGLEIAGNIMKSIPGVRPMLDALDAYKENRVEVLGNAFSDPSGFGNPDYDRSSKVWKEITVGGPIGRLLTGVRIVRDQDIYSLGPVKWRIN